MSANSKIEWCDATVNFWWGCTKVSPGCAHCYADSFSHRLGKDVWGNGKPREDHREGARKLALQLNRKAEKAGRRLRVFCASMSDWLDDEVPIEWLADLLATIHATPNLDWLLLTKRPENWRARVNAVYNTDEREGDSGSDFRNALAEWFEDERGPFMENIWIGTSVEDQTRADERIPLLLQIPAVVRFLSCEPLLGAVDLLHIPHADGTRQDALFGLRWHPNDRIGNDEMPKIDWVICGGESGAKARPMHPDWARSLRDQCHAAGVPFFFKQWGEWKRNPAPVHVRNRTTGDFETVPAGIGFNRVGKKAAGRLLDGREWSEFPEVQL